MQDCRRNAGIKSKGGKSWKIEIQPGLDGDFQLELDKLEACGNLRVLPETCSEGKWIEAGGRRMLNLSSNDYLGLASDKALREEFLRTVKERDFVLLLPRPHGC